MRNKFTKLFLASLVILALVISASAYTITVNNDAESTGMSIEGDTFHAFQIFSGNDDASVYWVTENFRGFFTGTLTDADGDEYDFDQYLDIIKAYEATFDDGSDFCITEEQAQTKASGGMWEVGQTAYDSWFTYNQNLELYNYYAGAYVENCESAMNDLAMAIRTYVDELIATADSTEVCDGHVTVEAGAQSATIEVDNYGYYFVMDDSSTIAGLGITASGSFIPVTSDNITISVKNSIPTLDKQIRHDDQATENEDGSYTGGWDIVGDHQIGDTVEYLITTTLPKNIGDYIKGLTSSEYLYVLYDEMDAGMTLDGAPVIYIDSARTEELDAGYYTVYDVGDVALEEFELYDYTQDNVAEANKVTLASIIPEAATFVIVVDVEEFAFDGDDGYTYQNGSGGTTIPSLYTYYTATLNENATLNKDYNTNSATLVFNNSTAEAYSYDTTDEQVFNYTFVLNVTKLDQDSEPLAGVEFGLYAHGNYIPLTLEGTVDGVDIYYPNSEATDGYITTNATGKFQIIGLNDEVTYTLVEEEAPSGYNAIDPMSFTISVTYDSTGTAITNLYQTHSNISLNNDSEFYTTIINLKTVILPSTGGMGTIIFQVGGALIMVIAIAFLLMKKKKSNTEENVVE